MARQIVLVFEENKTFLVETDFSRHEVEEVAEIIQEELMDTDDGWNEDKIVQALEKKGYIKVLGEGPEIIDLSLI